MIVCWMIAGALAAVVVLHAFFEVHYFLRMFVTVFLAKFFRKRAHIFDETYVYGICATTDIDTLLYHMNNARYLRELDFARADFYERTNFWKEVCSQGTGVVQNASTIRYRRYLKPFSLFKITSKIIYWDDKTIFMEHKFITTSDGFVRAIALCRNRLLDCNPESVISKLINNQGTKKHSNVESPVPQLSQLKPQIPLEVQKWLECNEISSASLRQTQNNNIPTVASQC